MSGTVWVLAADMMEGGHPQVLGVYDNEDAAEDHEQAIRENNGCIRQGDYDYPVASFWTYEKEVDSQFDQSDTEADR